jgi:hypothetical protein
MDVEMEAMKEHSVNQLALRPIGRNIVGSKWALHIKRKVNGEVDKYKA